MLIKKENGWHGVTELLKKDIFEFSEGYKDFLNIGKTERTFVSEAIKSAEKEGFVDANTLVKLKAGDKIYYENRGKNLILAIIGTESIVSGINYVVSHIDSPRLDLKQNPLYEEMELAYMRTHYYGGIKKYHWVTLPLAMHGVVVLENGEKVSIEIGEKEDDPVFTIPDLFPHLWGKSQAERKLRRMLRLLDD
jgi:aspartyl aminopeptidase